ncbi:hypothetical protein C0Q70_04744 [Pomacea canaliculata]|uniref:SOCS box domain-containing protein n=1 Tax=Pomacea canaliculata TaxID=400727 RepID=A0A2T7PJ88_POMCA|nr:hypothetical protein C0Q70_04744 [Pomacea canaliculata]
MTESVDLVSEHLAPLVNLNLRDNEGFTLLMRASQQPSPEGECVNSNSDTVSVIKHLLDSGVNPEARSPDGMTAFEMAVQFGNENWNYVVVLLQHGAKVDNQALLRFIVANHKLIPHAYLTAVLDAMQARGMDFNSLDREGNTILFTKDVYSSISSGQDPSGSLFKILVDRGANPLVPDRHGYSLLRFAIGVDKDYGLYLLKFLVRTGVTTHQPILTDATRSRPKRKDYFDKSVHYMPSPTEAAFKVEDVQAFKLLIESGASNNRELFELIAQLEENCFYKTKVKTEMLNILKQAASQPRSLKSWCRLTVSHALICGTRREEKVTCLPVPQRLQQYILFHDILSEELQTPEEISHHKQSRRERRGFSKPTIIFCCRLGSRSPPNANTEGE